MGTVLGTIELLWGCSHWWEQVIFIVDQNENDLGTVMGTLLGTTLGTIWEQFREREWEQNGNDNENDT